MSSLVILCLPFIQFICQQWNEANFFVFSTAIIQVYDHPTFTSSNMKELWIEMDRWSKLSCANKWVWVAGTYYVDGLGHLKWEKGSLNIYSRQAHHHKIVWAKGLLQSSPFVIGQPGSNSNIYFVKAFTITLRSKGTIRSN